MNKGGIFFIVTGEARCPCRKWISFLVTRWRTGCSARHFIARTTLWKQVRTILTNWNIPPVSCIAVKPLSECETAICQNCKQGWYWATGFLGLSWYSRIIFKLFMCLPGSVQCCIGMKVTEGLLCYMYQPWRMCDILESLNIHWRQCTVFKGHPAEL